MKEKNALFLMIYHRLAKMKMTTETWNKVKDQLKYVTKNLQHNNIKVDIVNTLIKRATLAPSTPHSMIKFANLLIKLKSRCTHKKNLIIEPALTLIIILNLSVRRLQMIKQKIRLNRVYMLLRRLR